MIGELSQGRYYVTCSSARRSAILLGPFETHSEALNNIQRAIKLACERDCRAWFYTYGTARSLARLPVLFS